MSAVKFSAGFNPVSPGAHRDTAIIDAVLEQAEWMDDAGIACVYTTEHHFSDYGAHSNNFLMSSYLAGAMKQAHVGFSICVVPLHHPARLAEMANLLDQLSKGKFIFGLGGGGIPLEFAGYGLHAADSTELHDEVFDVVLDLWAKKPEDPPIEINVRDIYRGTVYQRIMPGPFTPGGPPIKLAVTSPQRLEKAAKYGWSAFLFPPMIPIFRSMLEANGHSPEVVDRALEWSSSGANIVVAETDEEAKEEAIVHLMGRTKVIAQNAPYEEKLTWMRMKPGPGFLAGGPGGAEGDLRASAEAQLSHATYGSPDTVFERLKDFVDMGAREVNVGTDLGLYDEPGTEAMKRSLRLFLDEVLPRLQAHEPDLERGQELLANMPMPPPMAGGGEPPPSDEAPVGAGDRR